MTSKVSALVKEATDAVQNPAVVRVVRVPRATHLPELLRTAHKTAAAALNPEPSVEDVLALL